MSGFDTFVTNITNPEFIITGLASIAAFATVVTLGMPVLAQDKLAIRLKSVTMRREELRAQHKRDLEQSKPQLRQNSKGVIKGIVDQLNLQNLLASPDLKRKLAQAGLRGQAPFVTFLFFRMVLPFILFGAALTYLFVLSHFTYKPMVKVCISFGAAILGYYLPTLIVSNMIQKRQDKIMKAFPDALDLLLICVEAGMSIEAAFNRVAKEIGTSSVELAEELGLTTAELSYLQDRRQAYENLGQRTGLTGVKAVCTALVQAERYGTPLGTALRVMAHENREMRMQAAEKKAASLPAKLTVPMIVFFLPCLFVVILGPAFIKFKNNTAHKKHSELVLPHTPQFAVLERPPAKSITL
ncbi:MAG: type II secretion system F family protein [Alphaproteobacteria bacterium]